MTDIFEPPEVHPRSLSSYATNSATIDGPLQMQGSLQIIARYPFSSSFTVPSLYEDLNNISPEMESLITTAGIRFCTLSVESR